MVVVLRCAGGGPLRSVGLKALLPSLFFGSLVFRLSVAFWLHHRRYHETWVVMINIHRSFGSSSSCSHHLAFIVRLATYLVITGILIVAFRLLRAVVAIAPPCFEVTLAAVLRAGPLGLKPSGIGRGRLKPPLRPCPFALKRSGAWSRL